LVKEGTWINPCIKPAIFQLKNKLPYPGLKTTETLHGPHVLAKIPKKLLLTTKKALEEPALQDVYK
jgi:hypothetical protein